MITNWIKQWKESRTRVNKLITNAIIRTQEEDKKIYDYQLSMAVHRERKHAQGKISGLEQSLELKTKENKGLREDWRKIRERRTELLIAIEEFDEDRQKFYNMITGSHHKSKRILGKVHELDRKLNTIQLKEFDDRDGKKETVMEKK